MLRLLKEGHRRKQLTIYDWHLKAKAWGAIGIRDPGSPCPDRWELDKFFLNLFQLTHKLLAWEVQSQGWNSKELTGAYFKRWNMWFNSMIRAKPYQPRLGVAWLSSARVVRCVAHARITGITLNCFYSNILYNIKLYINKLKVKALNLLSNKAYH